jgi:hypothetical protein
LDKSVSLDVCETPRHSTSSLGVAVSLDVNVLAGLPPYGEVATNFSKTGQVLHSEGLVVSFRVDESSHWIGNFALGLSKFDFVQLHPNHADAIVIAGGQGYLIDPVTKKLQGTTGGAIVDAFLHPATSAIVLNHQNIWFESIGPSGRLWLSRRISWDGFRLIEVSGNALAGEGCRYDGTWHPFQLDLVSGNVEGGSYQER